MSEYQEFRSRHYVKALRIDETGYVFTSNGKEYATEGDYLIKDSNGNDFVATGQWFEDEYEPVSQELSEVRRYDPAGKTVDEVIEFLKEHPEEIERVKQLERDAGTRKGILTYER